MLISETVAHHTTCGLLITSIGDSLSAIASTRASIQIANCIAVDAAALHVPYVRRITDIGDGVGASMWHLNGLILADRLCNQARSSLCSICFPGYVRETPTLRTEVPDGISVSGASARAHGETPVLNCHVTWICWPNCVPCWIMPCIKDSRLSSEIYGLPREMMPGFPMLHCNLNSQLVVMDFCRRTGLRKLGDLIVVTTADALQEHLMATVKNALNQHRKSSKAFTKRKVCSDHYS